ncbi:uncharacterized protein LOC62_07G009590 [Vanrija pseudolonga]|uniref:Uncharacterized protein n=1 Tax=Vanrija pseudolonga TaxID=143232 RepID=A0AAF0YKK9_9TREE|nr:hypothetical protein LOC62_07G009590 [Vanrija pseudolonga]
MEDAGVQGERRDNIAWAEVGLRVLAIVWVSMFVVTHGYAAVVLWMGAKPAIKACLWWLATLAFHAFISFVWVVVAFADFGMMVGFGFMRCVLFIIVIIRWLDDPMFGTVVPAPVCDVPTAALLLGMEVHGQCLV